MRARLRPALVFLVLVLWSAAPAVAQPALDDDAELVLIDELLAQGDPAAALARAEALAVSPDLERRNRWRARQRLGAALVAVGRAAEAVPVLEAAIGEVEEASLHLNLGRALAALGKRGRAVAEYQRALLLDPTEPIWQLEYAEVLLALGVQRDAELAIARARDLCGDCPPSLRAAANLALVRGDHAGAIEPLTALFERGGEAEIRELLVESLWNLGDVDGASAVLDSVAVPGLSPDEMMVLAQLERRHQRADRVVGWVTDPRGTLPEGWQPPARFWAVCAEVCLAAGLPAVALTAIDRAIASEPAVGLYHHNRAAALVGLGRDDEARRALAEARRLSPDLGGGS